MKESVEIRFTKWDISGYARFCTAHGIHNLIYADILKYGNSERYKQLVAPLKKIKGIHGFLSYKLNEVATLTDSMITMKGLQDILREDEGFKERPNECIRL